MLPVFSYSPKETAVLLAKKARELRLMKEETRDELADRSGVTVASLKRFERTGRISLDRLRKLAMALDALEPFANLYEKPEVRALADLDRQLATRQRGRRKARAKPEDS